MVLIEISINDNEMSASTMKRRDLVCPRLARTWQFGPGAAGGGGTAPAEGTRASGASGSVSGDGPRVTAKARGAASTTCGAGISLALTPVQHSW